MLKRLTALVVCLVFVFTSALADVFTLPTALKVIGDRAFYNNTSMTEVVIPDGATSIGEEAFANSTVTKITIPSTVTTIGADAFANSALTEIVFTGDSEQWETLTIAEGAIPVGTEVSAADGDFVYGQVMAIVTEPEDQEVISGETVLLTVVAEGVDAYQWQYTKNGTTWNNLIWTGSGTETLSFTASAQRMTWQYRCVLTDKDGNELITRTVSLTDGGWKQAPVLTLKELEDGGIQLTWTASGTPDGYEVRVNGELFDTTAEQAYSLELMDLHIGENEITVVPYRAGEEETVYGEASNSVIYTKEGLTIMTQPTDQTVKVGEDVTLTVEATGVAQYRWQYSSNDGVTWRNASWTGYNTDTVTFTVNESNIGWQVRCMLKDEEGTAFYTDAVQFTRWEADVTVTFSKTEVLAWESFGVEVTGLEEGQFVEILLASEETGEEEYSVLENGSHTICLEYAGTYIVEVTVTDEDGEPVDGLTVQCDEMVTVTAYGKAPIFTVTDYAVDVDALTVTVNFALSESLSEETEIKAIMNADIGEFSFMEEKICASNASGVTFDFSDWEDRDDVDIHEATNFVFWMYAVGYEGYFGIDDSEDPETIWELDVSFKKTTAQLIFSAEKLNVDETLTVTVDSLPTGVAAVQVWFDNDDCSVEAMPFESSAEFIFDVIGEYTVHAVCVDEDDNPLEGYTIYAPETVSVVKTASGNTYAEYDNDDYWNKDQADREHVTFTIEETGCYRFTASEIVSVSLYDSNGKYLVN